jgi:O-antigen ligase
MFLAALLPALFFRGFQAELLALCQIFLVLWLLVIAWRARDQGVPLSRTALAWLLTLFSGWLAVTLLWSGAVHLSIMGFWWLGTLPFVFWLSSVTREPARVWFWAAGAVAAIASVLALISGWQALVAGIQASSVFETRNSHAAFMNLVAIPASAYFLIVAGRRLNSPGAIALATVVVLLYFSVFLTASRAGVGGLLLSLALLVVITWRNTDKRALVAMLALLAAAFLSTQLSHGEAAARAVKLATQDSARSQIWEASWEMLKVAPWFGTGLATYYLRYPAFRDPRDGSGGYFAHSDYLQIWIEAGLPALVLLLAVMAATARLFVRALRSSFPASRRIEMTGLFLGLLVTAGHSLVDFNLYILSVLMVAGIALARLHSLAVEALEIPVRAVTPGNWIGARFYRPIAVLLALLPLSYLAALGSANSLYDAAHEAAARGDLPTAERHLRTAARLTPADERILIAQADLLRHVIPQLPADDEARRRALFDEADRLLDEAERASRWRSLGFAVRGYLYRDQPQLAGPQWAGRAAVAFARALELDPRAISARVGYAELLLAHGQRGEALALLERGLRETYMDEPALGGYWRLTARVLRQAGRAREAAALEAGVRDLDARLAGH